MIKLLTSLLLFAIVGIAQAAELQVHTFSLHAAKTMTYEKDGVETDIKYNNFNPGLAYISDDGWIAGGYYNSFKKATVYVAKEIMLQPDFGFWIGAGTGYEIESNHKISVMGALVFKRELSERTMMRVMVLPFGTVPTVHFGFSYQLGS